jgi:hypothetical protein
MGRQTYLGAAAACFLAQLVLALTVTCGSGGAVVVVFWVLLGAIVTLTGIGLYVNSDAKHRLPAAIAGALVWGMVVFLAVMMVDYARCGAD